jgi:hypothetical protein
LPVLKDVPNEVPSSGDCKDYFLGCMSFSSVAVDEHFTRNTASTFKVEESTMEVACKKLAERSSKW